jgi:hypothetical protein
VQADSGDQDRDFVDLKDPTKPGQIQGEFTVNILQHLYRLAVAVLIAASPAFSGAAIQISANTVHDSSTDLTWYRDLSHFSNETAAEQLAGISALNASTFAGLSDWRLANFSELRTILLSMDLNSSPFVNSSTDGAIWYGGRYDSTPSSDPWSGTYQALKFTSSWLPDWPNGYATVYRIGPVDTNQTTGAWVVGGPYLSAPVPEPDTYSLAAVGAVLIFAVSALKNSRSSRREVSL